MTLAEKLTEISGKPGVIGAAIIPLSRPTGFETLDAAKISWYIDAGDGVARGHSAEFLISGKDTPQETVYAIGNAPVILQAETKFLTSRTAGGWGALTAAQQFTAIENFCNGVYIAANPSASNIREFNVSNVNGTTIRINGMFDIGTTWEPQSWYVRLIDANGSVAAPYANVELQKIVG